MNNSEVRKWRRSEIRDLVSLTPSQPFHTNHDRVRRQHVVHRLQLRRSTSAQSRYQTRDVNFRRRLREQSEFAASRTTNHRSEAGQGRAGQGKWEVGYPSVPLFPCLMPQGARRKEAPPEWGPKFLFLDRVKFLLSFRRMEEGAMFLTRFGAIIAMVRTPEMRGRHPDSKKRKVDYGI